MRGLLPSGRAALRRVIPLWLRAEAGPELYRKGEWLFALAPRERLVIDRGESVPDLNSTRVLHVITCLGIGGAEMMLAKLVEAGLKDGKGPVEEVISLVEPERVGESLRATGVPVHSLGMRRGLPSAWAVIELRQKLSLIQPDMIVAWMHHAQLAVGAATAFSRASPPVIWNVRHSLADMRNEKLLTRWVLGGCARLSAGTDAIIYNSRAAVSQFERIGFPAGKAVVIPNGFDCDRFAPDPVGREAMRRRLGIDGGVFLVGLLARSHPMKDVGMLVRAIRRVRSAGLDVHLLLGGRGMDTPAPAVARELAEIPAHRLTLLGERSDIAELLVGLDLLTLSSAWGEGFPNILGEAMASGVPCVATDVGDSAWVVGEAGAVVPPRDAEAMAKAIIGIASLDPEQREILAGKARSRVLELFEVGAVSRRYHALYASVLERRRRGSLAQALAGHRKAA
jgi:glycosyltransferase involved in cell wall biosynthesis